jgi:precorrin-2 dehydrogenase/sirohydrochlorin ferrochelatase
MDVQDDRPDLYPIALKLAGRRCLVVGGGNVAERKVQPLLAGGAEVVVVSPEAAPGIEALAAADGITLLRRDFAPGDADGAFLVIAAADDPAVNEAAYRAGKDRGALVNVVDVPAMCDFYVPALVRRGDLTIAVSTSGACPALAKRLRRELEAQFGSYYAAYVALLARLRERALAELNEPRERQAVLEAFLDSEALDLIRDGKYSAAEALLESHWDAIKKGTQS